MAQFELIPLAAGPLRHGGGGPDLLAESRITDDAFLPGLLPARLHWLLADREQCFAVEQTAEGLRIYEDPAGVLTNEPPFPMQLFRLNDYAQLSPQPPENHFSPALPLETYSRGMGAMGLPGDLSSPSRFVRTAFTRLNSRSGDGEAESVSQLLHILGAAAQQRGCCVLEDGACELTLYTSCCNADTGVYYYTTYDAAQLCAVDMHRADLDGTALACQPLDTVWRVHYQN